MRNLVKIVMLGPSGSGKTTLAKAIAEKFDIPFVENSAGKIMLPDLKETLSEYGYGGDAGQLGVIKLSTQNFSFGINFQSSVLESRVCLLRTNNIIVADRSPLDPAAYYLNQCVQEDDYDHSKDFIENCFRETMDNVTHIIRVPLLNPERVIEDNGSRIANWYFQNKIDLLMEDTFQEFIKWEQENKPKYWTSIHTHKVSTWDLDERIAEAIEFIDDSFGNY